MTRYIAFCKIVELGSFTRAADALGYTQAAVSQMIRSLETECQLHLIIRMRSGIQLTPEGEILYPMIRRMVAEQRQFLDKVHELTELEAGKIRIGTFSSVSQNMLPPLIRLFSDRYPGVKFVLRQGDNASIVDMIRQGRVDFGFVYPRSLPGLTVEELTGDSFLAVLPEEHPLAGHPSLTLADLANETIISLDEGNERTAESAFRDAGLTPDLKYLVYDDYTILAMIEEGLGIGILPAAILRHTRYRFRAVPFDPPLGRKIGIAYIDEELLPVAAQRFIGFIRTYLKEGVPLPKKSVLPPEI